MVIDKFTTIAIVNKLTKPNIKYEKRKKRETFFIQFYERFPETFVINERTKFVPFVTKVIKINKI
jgi:hypothetical protein